MNQTRIVLVAFIWLFLLGIGVAVWKFLLQPQRQAESERQRAEQEQHQIEVTEGTSRYRYDLALGLDSFSGYAILRSDQFRQRLASREIRIELKDDAADYPQRLDALESGQIQIAAFPIDALLKACSQRGKMPATIVALIDETRGADAMVAYRQKYPDIDALNQTATRIVLVGDSPSETLSRVVMQDFDLSLLGRESFSRVSSPEEVLQAYRKSTPSTDQVFVTWEPFVSEMLENEAMHVLVDSSKFTGYIVDALVVSRDFLVKQPEVVDMILESYFEALSSYRDPSQWKDLVLQDARESGSSLSDTYAQRLVDGIRWKNTLENYSHFGLRQDQLLHIEDILARISGVLVASGAIPRDPTDGQFNRLFYDKSLRNLQNKRFLPDELVRAESGLSALTDDQWRSLTPVGTLRVPELIFARGTDKLTPSSQQILDELADKLETWPAYYLQIEGNSAPGGNEQANLALAARRAEAAKEYLNSRGVSEARMKSLPGQVGQSNVVFILSELPY